MMKYEVPYVEIVRFTFKDAVLTGSEATEDVLVGGGDETVDEEDPFG